MYFILYILLLFRARTHFECKELQIFLLIGEMYNLIFPLQHCTHFGESQALPALCMRHQASELLSLSAQSPLGASPDFPANLPQGPSVLYMFTILCIFIGRQQPQKQSEAQAKKRQDSVHSSQNLTGCMGKKYATESKGMIHKWISFFIK